MLNSILRLVFSLVGAFIGTIIMLCIVEKESPIKVVKTILGKY